MVNAKKFYASVQHELLFVKRLRLQAPRVFGFMTIGQAGVAAARQRLINGFHRQKPE
jgi:hypothetical protein